MHSRNLQLFIIGGALALITGFIPFALAAPVDVTGQVIILTADCGLVIESGSPIDYGSLTNGQESAEKQLAFRNTGNTPGTLSVRGGDWFEAVGGSTFVMAVSDTSWKSQNGVKTALSTADASTGILLNPSGGDSLFWQLKPNLDDPTFTGNAKQSVTLTNIC